MQVTVESPNKIERRITIVVPVEKLNDAYEKQIHKIAKKAKIDGFRPGKVPLQVVKQQYGDAARHEALSDVIQSSLYEALNQEKLNPIGVPTVEPKQLNPDQPIEYVATFEVMPEVKEVHFDVKTLEKQVATITDDDINRVIDHLRQQHTTWKQVDRAAKDKDRVTIDFSGKIDNKVFPGGEAHDYSIVLGSKTMIPGFEDGIIGMSSGEEKVIQVKFPEDYFAKDAAGKEAEFTVKVIKIDEPELPELNADYIKKLGVENGSEEDLRKEIHKNLSRELARMIKTKLKNQVFEKLIEQNPLEIPKALIQHEAKRIHDEVHPNHGHDHHHTEAENVMFDQAATRNVMLGLLMAEIIKTHKLVADHEKIQQFISDTAAAYEQPAEVVKWYETDKKARAEIEMHILEEQIVEKLLENTNIVEKTLAYNELVKP